MNVDETFQQRLHLGKTNREAVLLEMATLRRRLLLPVARILPSKVQVFARIMRAKLKDRSSGFAKDYLRAVVSEIIVHGDQPTLCGSNTRLMELVAKGKVDTDQVPSSIQDWRAREDKVRTPCWIH